MNMRLLFHPFPQLISAAYELVNGLGDILFSMVICELIVFSNIDKYSL